MKNGPGAGEACFRLAEGRARRRAPDAVWRRIRGKKEGQAGPRTAVPADGYSRKADRRDDPRNDAARTVHDGDRAHDRVHVRRPRLRPAITLLTAARRCIVSFSVAI